MSDQLLPGRQRHVGGLHVHVDGAGGSLRARERDERRAGREAHLRLGHGAAASRAVTGAAAPGVQITHQILKGGLIKKKKHVYITFWTFDLVACLPRDVQKDTILILFLCLICNYFSWPVALILLIIENFHQCQVPKQVLVQYVDACTQNK